jgi:hypothetical protein
MAQQGSSPAQDDLQGDKNNEKGSSPGFAEGGREAISRCFCLNSKAVPSIITQAVSRGGSELSIFMQVSPA